jgi:hypothetical protein
MICLLTHLLLKIKLKKLKKLKYIYYNFVYMDTSMVPPVELEKKKMTQGWVVYGGIRHAEPQREMFSRSYGTMYLNVRANGLTNDCHHMRAFLCHLPDPGLICINTFILSSHKASCIGAQFYSGVQLLRTPCWLGLSAALAYL